jgi:hypothetical protein
MTDWVKIVATIVFGYFGTVWLNLGAVPQDVFLALLSAVWVLPPVGRALKLIPEK